MPKNRLKSKKGRGWRGRDWVVLLGGMVLMVALLAGWQLWGAYLTFSGSSGLTSKKMIELYRESGQVEVKNTDGWTVFLLLGTDELQYREESQPLTDTMMLVSVNPSEGVVNMLPLPRDVYVPEQGGKINAIYAQLAPTDRARAGEKTAGVISEILAVPIHYSLVVTLADVRDFLELIGGVEVTVVNSFTDVRYPRGGVDIRVVNDPALLYETVSFEAGERHLTAEEAIKFMRSRHGEGVEGSDYARAVRQQQVLAAVGGKVGQTIREQGLNYDFSFLGELYQFYEQKFENQVPFVEALALGRKLWGRVSLPEVKNERLSIAPEVGASLREEERGEWRLMIMNREALKEEVRGKLGVENE